MTERVAMDAIRVGCASRPAATINHWSRLCVARGCRSRVHTSRFAAYRNLIGAKSIDRARGDGRHPRLLRKGPGSSRGTVRFFTWGGPLGQEDRPERPCCFTGCPNPGARPTWSSTRVA